MDYITILTTILVVMVTIILFCYTWLNRKRTRIPGMVDISKHGREIGNWERLLVDFVQLGTFINSYVIFLDSKVQLTQDMLIKAAIKIRSRHPILRMRILDVIDSNGVERKFFQPIENSAVDVKSIIGDDWIEVHSNELATGFDTLNGPLWRLRLLKGTTGASQIEDVYKSTFIVTFHHSIIDGITMMHFVDELLDYLDQVVKGNDDIPESLPLYPSLEKAIGITHMPWWKVFITFVVLAKQHFFKPSNPYIDRFGMEMIRNPGVHHETKVIPIEFTKQETTMIKTYSSEHKATVNGTLLAAANLAIARIINRKSQKSIHIRTEFLANLRGMCTPPLDPKESFGTYAPPYIMHVDVSSATYDRDAFGKFASSLTQRSHEMVRKGEGQELVQFVRVLYDLGISFENFHEDSVRDQKSGYRGGGVLLLSNLGNLNYFTKDKPRVFEITSKHNACSMHKMGSIFDNYAATIHGRLLWTVAYATNVVTKEQAQEFADMVVDVLRKMCLQNKI
ncbi:uncharacterized protein LOC144357572 [Saccoglossus kowalevskii]